MKEIIWFFGSSAAGKKTLINKILAQPDNFRTDLGILFTTIKANKEALEWITKKNHNERLKLIDLIDEDLKEEKDITLLVKGQAVDLKNDLIGKLAEEISNIKQRIVFVYTEPLEELDRLKMHRTWYTPDMTEDFVIDEINYQLGFLKKYQSKNIQIICIDGGNNGKYRIIDLPQTRKKI